MIPPRLRRSLLVGSLAALACLHGMGQSSKEINVDGHLVWVLPFQNNSAQPGFEWIGASFPVILNQRFSSAGFLTIRREDRRYALKHLGLPADFRPTQATTFRLAQTLDADYVVFGNYTVANNRITASARVLVMNGPRMNAEVEEQGSLDQLIHIEDDLAWKLAMQIEPSLNLDEQTFLAASRNLRLDAFENYIRGQVAPDIDGQIAHFMKAVELSPNYVQAWFALGRAYFANQQYEQAEGPFGKIPKGSRLWLEAMFYAGLSHLYTGNYDQAQNEFAAIAAVLPMPEVLNNEGIAINRRGGNGTAFFQRVVQLNPQNADYWFNLAVSQRRTKDYDAAIQAVGRCLMLRPQDEEAQHLKTNLLMLKNGPPAAAVQAVSTAEQPASAAGKKPSDTDEDADSSPAEAASAATDTGNASDSANDAASSANDAASPVNDAASSGAATSPDYEPLERIARSYDESSFRQAAFEMEQMNAMKLRSLPVSARTKLLCQQGTEYINDGLLLEAERQFQLAIASYPTSAAAHAGLAQVHEYAGSTKIAKQDANTSIQEKPNVAAYLVLARIALAERSYSQALANVNLALKIDPKNSAARGIAQAIQAQQSRQ